MRLFVAFLVIFSFLLVAPFVAAQSEPLSSQSVSLAPSKLATEDYELPYPGLLPDNPLYSLKMLRDRIVEFLIADPAKRTEFYILQADKRLQAGAYLLTKRTKKEQSAVSTISKGQNYFEKALVSLSFAEKEGKDVRYLMEKISFSLNKHEEVLVFLLERIPISSRGEFTILQERIAKFKNAFGKL